MSDHCCEGMRYLIEDPLAPIAYAPEIRSYALTIPSSYLGLNELCVSFIIAHCPRCGAQLPKDVADEWSEIVRKQFHITDELDEDQLKSLPQEFKTDEWWKKRGL
jgi:hypothetical protein